MFAEYVDSRLGIHMREDEIRIGRVVDDVTDGLTRVLFLENIRFSDRNDTFLVEANTFIDYKYMVTRSAKYQILPSSRFVYIESIKAIFKQECQGGIRVSCEVPLQGTLITS